MLVAVLVCVCVYCRSPCHLFIYIKWSLVPEWPCADNIPKKKPLFLFEPLFDINTNRIVAVGTDNSVHSPTHVWSLLLVVESEILGYHTSPIMDVCQSTLMNHFARIVLICNSSSQNHF